MDGNAKKERRGNPRENANFISAATFSYTLPTFWRGYKRELQMNDLTETLTEHKSGALADRIEGVWQNEEKLAKTAGRAPSLRRVLWRVFGCEFMFYGLVLAFGEFGIRLVQPIALGQLIAYYIPEQTSISLTEAYLYAGAVVLCSLLNVFATHPYMMGMLHLGMKMRIACCSLIYRKSLRLSKTALGQTTAGQLVNLLSNDVNRFDVGLLFAHQLWVGPLETVVVAYLMYREIGDSVFVGILVLLAFIPLQIFLGRRTSVLRLRTAIRTDERVRLMNEIISGIQVIKMYTWEKPFAKLVSLARRFEIKSVRGTSFVRGILLSFIMFTTRISIFASVLTFVLLGHQITAERVFVVTSFYNILRSTMTVFFPQGISQVAEAFVSIGRLNKFLLYDENPVTAISSSRINLISTNKSPEHKSAVTNGNSALVASLAEVPLSEKGVYMTDIHAKWSGESSDDTLRDITLTATPGSLVAIIGPVGSGKTSLLHVILRELPTHSGSMRVCGEVSYASQEPWLFAGTVRQNILFGLPMERSRYKAVIRRCALERDFTLLPHGDKTIVGERGVSLSGGQRARINLARAVYKEADIYLLDDPLSAVDTHVGKQLFDECVTGFLRRKTCILITHQLQYLKEVDHIYILNNGIIEAQGSYRELQASGLDFAKLLEKEQPENAAAVVKNPEEITTSRGSLSRHNSVHSVESVTVDGPSEAAPQSLGVEETKKTGSVGSYVYRSYFGAGGRWFAITTLMLLFIIAQLSASGGDYFLTFWVNLEERRYIDVVVAQKLMDTIMVPNGNQSSMFLSMQNRMEEEGFWTRDNCIYFFSALTIMTVSFTLVRSFYFFNVCMRASVNLHDRMFTSITHATMRFFNTNPSGRILNRFSKDMGAIDELLPAALIDVLQIGLTLAGIIVVVGTVNPYLMIPTAVIAVIFYWLRLFYLATGRSVKRLEGVTRSPVFSHINASIQGLTTIRAFKAQAILEKEFDNHQDLHSSAWFMFLATSRAFGFWLDMVCIVYIAIVTLSFLVVDSESFGGNVGLAITQAIGLTGMFQWGMRQSTELENQMTSVERVLEYSDLPSEGDLEKKSTQTNKEWPSVGELKFDNVNLRYAPTEPHVLHDLNFTITSKEKIGIVGRTGAGKSSLISALFRLAETDGAIILDDVDTKSIGLHDLRSKLSIIPQEPVLFSGTMRKNLDPFDEYDDATLWRALEDVELKEVIADLAAGLNSVMSEGGSNFSVGQRQLVCLARAIIRNNRVLILDEATANVDPQTDALIQKTIRKKFAECTVLTIAHRLNTVMDSDRVLVMDAGTMVELDQPHKLLQNNKGVFNGMVEQTGKEMADKLRAIAEENYKMKSHSTSPS